MCTTCGCGGEDHAHYTALTGGPVTSTSLGHAAHDHGHPHAHRHVHTHAHARARDHDHGHDHDHHHRRDRDEGQQRHRVAGSAPGATIELGLDLLEKNQRLAERNRGWLAGRNIAAINLMSSPGSGKTTLLERTIGALGHELGIHVVEGDQATLNDAQRIEAAGCKVVQVNTGTGCHLEADMFARGLQDLCPPVGSLVMIENVGNLVCPALFDLGEHAKVVMLAVTDGEDKPLKYPHMFRASQVMIINKIDLLPYVRFDIDRCVANAREVNPAVRVLCLSAETGEGMDGWYGWLREAAASARTLELQAL
jgi:hydrogenase nickel incorporation protein HypB